MKIILALEGFNDMVEWINKMQSILKKIEPLKELIDKQYKV